ncbi:hypothetical protein AB1E18_002420 [Capra hircus]
MGAHRVYSCPLDLFRFKPGRFEACMAVSPGAVASVAGGHRRSDAPNGLSEKEHRSQVQRNSGEGASRVDWKRRSFLRARSADRRRREEDHRGAGPQPGRGGFHTAGFRGHLGLGRTHRPRLLLLPGAGESAGATPELRMCLLIGKTNRRERHGVRQGTQLEEEVVTTCKSLYSALGDLEVEGSAHHPPLITEPDDRENRGSQREQDLGSAARSATARPGGTQSATLCPCPRAKATPRKGEVKADEPRGQGWEPCTAAHSPGPLRRCLSSLLTFRRVIFHSPFTCRG